MNKHLDFELPVWQVAVDCVPLLDSHTLDGQYGFNQQHVRNGITYSLWKIKKHSHTSELWVGATTMLLCCVGSVCVCMFPPGWWRSQCSAAGELLSSSRRRCPCSPPAAGSSLQLPYWTAPEHNTSTLSHIWRLAVIKMLDWCVCLIYSQFHDRWPRSKRRYRTPGLHDEGASLQF